MPTDLKIGAETFRVLPIASAWDSFALQTLFGPSVLELFGIIGEWPKLAAAVAAAKGGSALDVEVLDVVPLIAPHIGRALGKVLPADLRALMVALFENVIVTSNGKDVRLPDVFAVLMQGRTIDTWKLLLAAVKENYPDFFALLGAKGGALGKGSAGEASNTSGTSGHATG